MQKETVKNNYLNYIENATESLSGYNKTRNA